MSTLTSSVVTTINPSLDKALRTLITNDRPRRIIETGTGLGLGSTLTICEALTENGLPLDEFYSIEANPDSYARAWTNLGQHGFRPRLLRGLSIPRSLLPSEADLRGRMPEREAHALRPEAYFPDSLDDLLGFALVDLDYAPDLLFLDSAEHLGFIEFQYAFSRIKGPCFLALNAVRPVKHAQSLQMIESDPRFKLLELSLDHGGFCTAHFEP